MRYPTRTEQSVFYVAGKQCQRAVFALTVLVGLSGLVASANAAAEDQFWVSLGSYAKVGAAEKMRDKAAGEFYELSVVAADSPVGPVYRVVDGPIFDRASADLRVEQARNAGFIDAWILVRDSAQEWASADSYSESPSSDYLLQDTPSSQILGDFPGEEIGGTASSDDYETVTIGKEELVETAPTGYGLHQLNRPSGQLAPGEAQDSRLSELRSKKE